MITAIRKKAAANGGGKRYIIGTALVNFSVHENQLQVIAAAEQNLITIRRATVEVPDDSVSIVWNREARINTRSFSPHTSTPAACPQSWRQGHIAATSASLPWQNGHRWTVASFRL